MSDPTKHLTPSSSERDDPLYWLAWVITLIGVTAFAIAGGALVGWLT